MKRSFFEKVNLLTNVAEPLKSQLLSRLEKSENKMIFYKSVKRTSDPNVFFSNQDLILWNSEPPDNDKQFMEIGFTTLEKTKYYEGDVILECEVDTKDIIDIHADRITARKCKILKVIE